MNVRTLRFKLSLTNGLFISIFFVLFGLIRYQTFAYRSQAIFDRGLERQADFFANNVRPTQDGFDWQPDVAPADALLLDTIRPFFVLTDLDGKVLREEFYGYYVRRMLNEKDLDSVLHRQSGFSNAETSDGRRFRFISRILRFENGRQVVLHLGRSQTELAEVLHEYTVLYGYSVPLLVVIAGGVGWFLAAHALKPFEEVARTAEQITSEKLDTQIEVARQEAEVQKLVSSFNSMVARLALSFEQMRKFNANVAHELRTPLAILQGENEVALRSESLPEDVRAVMISNLEELERLTRIVNDLLILSEAETGGQALERKPINFKPLIRDLADDMQLLAMERNIAIEVDELLDAVVIADDLWVRRAVLNVLDNAIKYSRDGGKVRVSMSKDPTHVWISIRDEGIGIGKADLPHIFERFFRADPARNRSSGGTGLGLALVKWVVEAHRGRIKVASEPDRGTDFQIAFPLQAPAPRAGVEGRAAKASRPAQHARTR